MVTIQVSSQNPGAVTARLKNFVLTRNGKLETQIIEEGLDRAYQRVYKDARVKTGYMRSTIHVEVKPGVGVISVGAFYSIFIEKGTRHSHAFPFFWSNVHASGMTIMQQIRELYMK
jgi:hypothetical protein